MNASLGDRYARGEFETRVIDGEAVQERIRRRTYGFVLREYVYPDGKSSKWGVIFPGWSQEVVMSTDEAETLRLILNDVLDP